MRLDRYVFARLYGYMLGRSFRNTPEQACQDAITPYMIVVGLPSTMVILIPMTLLFPQLAKTKDWIPWFAVCSAVVLYRLMRQLRQYADTPDMAVPYRSASSRAITALGFLGVLISSVAVGAIGLRLLHTN
jgi:hypothetical protein